MDEKILIIDDEKNVCELIVDSFSKEELIVHTASKIEDALTFLENNEYNIVVTDKNYPGLENNSEGGLEILKIVKFRYPSTEVIVMTGFASIDSAIESVRFGAFDYIVKPFKIAAFKKKINKILSFQASLNPDNIIPVYKSLQSDFAALISKKEEISIEDQNELLDTMKKNLDLLFSAQKDRERVIYLQREALAIISGYAERLREDEADGDIKNELIEKICAESSKRI
jgi:DNA-binding NtrC family response regulator